MTGNYPVTFAAALRESLPSGPGDYLAYAAAALALRLVAGFSLAVTAASTAVIIAVTVLAFAAARYTAAPRSLPPALPGDDEADDGDG